MRIELRVCLLGLLGLVLWTAWGGRPAASVPPSLAIEAGDSELSVVERLARTAALLPPPVRTSLGEVRPPEDPPEAPEEPVIPPTAAVLRLLRWPDGAVLAAGTRVQIVETGTGRIQVLKSPPSGRIRLSDELRSDSYSVYVRAAGFEPLRVEGQPVGKGFAYVAHLRPTVGWYGQVIDHKGSPQPGLQVSGFWVEDQRPAKTLEGARLLGRSVQARLDPDAAERAPARRSNRSKRREDRAAAPPPAFIAAHDRVEATAVTDSEGWYYIPPLAGFVLGTLNLLVEDSPGSSDVLRVTLPSTSPRLPRLTIHRPRLIVVTVVDPNGAPIEGAKVLQALDGGWSPEWGPYATDEHGRAHMPAHYADTVLGVEAIGFALAAPAQWRPKSADRLWQDVRQLVPAAGLAKAYFRMAYGKWDAVFPRARGLQPVPFLASDALLIMEPEGSLLYQVVTSGTDNPIAGARVTVRYGGLDPTSQIEFTAADGTAEVPLSDREWQPMLVTVTAVGFRSEEFLVPPGPASSFRAPTKIALASGSDGERDADENSETPNGEVLAPTPDASAVLAMRSGGPTNRGGKRVWSGSADRSGGFRYSFTPKPKDPPYYLYAVHQHPQSGLPLSGGVLGPIEFDDDVLYDNAPLPFLTVNLEAGLGLRVILDGLEPDRPYRLDWSLRPHVHARTVTEGRLNLPADHGVRHELEIPVPRGWVLRAQLQGAAVGHGPALALDRGDTPADKPLFLSNAYSWEAWQPVTGLGQAQVQFSGRSLYLRSARRAMLAGTVTNLSTYPEPGVVQIAAIGPLGTWYSPVSGNGWFEYPSLPLGAYRLLLYERPSAAGGPAPPEAQGTLRREIAVDLELDRFDVELPWDLPEPASEDQ